MSDPLTEAEFRAKYPHSSDEQVRLYLEEAAAPPPAPEPDILMPLIQACPELVERVPVIVEQIRTAPITSYDLNPNVRTVLIGGVFDIPPESEPTCTADELRKVILRNFKVTPEQRQRLESDSQFTENDMLAMLAGVPSAREFAGLE